MHSPDYLFSATAQPVEKYFIVKEVTMYVVNVNHIRVNPFDFFYKFLCRFYRGEPMFVEQSCSQSVKRNAHPVTYRNCT